MQGICGICGFLCMSVCIYMYDLIHNVCVCVELPICTSFASESGLVILLRYYIFRPSQSKISVGLRQILLGSSLHPTP